MSKSLYSVPNTEFRILFQGDSITDGNRSRNSDPNHIMGHGYAFSVAAKIGADYPERNYQFINRGISGNKIVDMAKRWQKDTLALKPNLLSILIGINDASSVVFNWQPVVSVEIYENTYDELLQQTCNTLPEVELVLCEPYILKAGNVAKYWESYKSDVTARQEVVNKMAEKYKTLFVGFQEVFEKACEQAPRNTGYGMVSTLLLPDMS